MLAALTAPDGPGGVEVVRKLMEMGNIHNRSKQVERRHNEGKERSIDTCVVGLRLRPVRQLCTWRCDTGGW